MTTPSLRSRVLLIDLLKATAAQLIVLHHLAWFGPLSEQVVGLGYGSAEIIAWFAHYGRYAVAVFIVTSGFLAAQFLPMRGLLPGDTPGCLIRERYLRLAMPFAAALLLAIICNVLARQWMSHDSLGSPPQLLQFIVHVLMLQGLLDVEALSAGVWYVAIDFQLYVLFVLLLWIGQRLPDWSRRPASADFSGAAPVLLFALASLFYFNLDARWDDTALYFFGAYALGIGSGWAIRSEQRNQFLWVICIAGLLALSIDFRPRLAIALVTALVLGFSRLHMPHWEVRLVHYLGGTSYALFLVHFPVYLLVSAVFLHLGAGAAAPGLAALGLGVTWILSMLAAHVFHRWVELPIGRYRKRRLQCSSRLRK
jgi:peptidoglycan/LPS O-acetylase OafA/YrhL